MTPTNFNLYNFVDLVEPFFGAQRFLCDHMLYVVSMCKEYISKSI